MYRLIFVVMVLVSVINCTPNKKNELQKAENRNFLSITSGSITVSLIPFYIIALGLYIFRVGSLFDLGSIFDDDDASGYGVPGIGGGYEALDTGYGTPNEGYGAPSQSYNAPTAQSYDAPASSYGAAPTSNYGTPGLSYRLSSDSLNQLTPANDGLEKSALSPAAQQSAWNNLIDLAPSRLIDLLTFLPAQNRKSDRISNKVDEASEVIYSKS